MGGALIAETDDSAAHDYVDAGGHSPRRRRSSGRRRSSRDRTSPFVTFVWLAPALALIIGVVVYPMIKLVQTSRTDYSLTGLPKGNVGFDKYLKVFQHPAFGTVLWNTLVWVVGVVTITIVIGLALAQFLAKDFYGRKFVRWALIVPWAASLIITARLFTLIFDFYRGILNEFLVRLNLVDQPIDFLGDERWIMPSMIAVGVFVSLPFTAYVLLAGLNGIPDDVREAAQMDGATSWQRYRLVTIPLLRPALLVATVLNAIYVFNSFPIVFTLNERNPGFGNDTSITFMYKLAFKSAEQDVGMSAAAGVINVFLIFLVVMVYLRTVKWQEDPAQ